jgi:hypothetical protein
MKTPIPIKVCDAGDDPEPEKLTPSDAYLERRRLAKRLQAAAQQLDVPPQYEAGNPVRCRGEPLCEPIYWQGRQWAVTAFGIECRDGCYVIKKSRVWENEDRHGWIMHMAGKNWADLEDFAEALRIARRRWRQFRKTVPEGKRA